MNQTRRSPSSWPSSPGSSAATQPTGERLVRLEIGQELLQAEVESHGETLDRHGRRLARLTQAGVLLFLVLLNFLGLMQQEQAAALVATLLKALL